VLSAYGWPGNIRELRNVLEQVTLTSDGPRLTAEEFTLVLPRVTSAARHGERPTLRLADIVADAERGAILSELGLTAQGVTRRVVEELARLEPDLEGSTSISAPPPKPSPPTSRQRRRSPASGGAACSSALAATSRSPARHHWRDG